jgi:hypothetical protein
MMSSWIEAEGRERALYSHVILPGLVYMLHDARECCVERYSGRGRALMLSLWIEAEGRNEPVRS